MKRINIGMLGFGNVGSGVYTIIKNNFKEISEKEGISLNIKKILVKDINKQRTIDINKELLTDNPECIFKDPDIDIVAEFMGGEKPAFDYLINSLNNGKSVVTANKEVLSKYWEALDKAAKENKTGLYFEASVAGGIPVIKAVNESLQGNRINKVMGIINGTTNYILTKMTEKGATFSKMLSKAQELGYAEPDPTSDVEGYDARYKLSILSTLCFNQRVKIEDIYCEGIKNISSEDISYAKELGFTIKLLAIAKRYDNYIEARVHPTFIPNEHPLASVRDSFNAVFINGDAVGDLMFYGRGAGDLPTGSAIVSDIITASKNIVHRYADLDIKKNQLSIQDNWKTEYYMRLTVLDKPGVLAEIAGIFGKYDVSIASVIQKERGGKTTPLIFVTHEAGEKDINRALENIKNSKFVLKIDNVIRVEKK